MVQTHSPFGAFEVDGLSIRSCCEGPRSLDPEGDGEGSEGDDFPVFVGFGCGKELADALNGYLQSVKDVDFSSTYGAMAV